MKKAQQGFTLVELAVVMIVIGVLSGGVLMSINMVQQARVNETIKFVNSTNAAVNAFYEKYRARPGDALRAQSQVPGCAAGAPYYCLNGDGNNYIASDGTDQYNWRSKIGTSTPEGYESLQFWKHLALAEIISGVDPAANPSDSSTTGWGKSHPDSSFGGGYEMYFDGFIATGGGGASSGASHIMRLSSTGLSTEQTAGIVNTVNSFGIDKKMDDGDPNAGLVIADYGTQNNGCKTTAGSEARYNSDTPQNQCILYFRLFAR